MREAPNMLFRISLGVMILLLGATGRVYAADDIDALLYSGAKVDKFTEQETSEGRVILSAPKRVSNTLRLEQEKWVSGFQQIWLLKLDRNTDLASVKDYYASLVSQQGELMFSCDARACGTSSDWANKLLGESVLTGRDNYQYFLSGSFRHNDTPGWLSVYIVTNGRRQNYAYVQYISEGTSGKFGPSDIVYLQADDLDAAQRDRIKGLFASSNYLLISMRMRQTNALSRGDWASRTERLESWLVEYLNSLVPEWKSRAQILPAAPTLSPPPEIEADSWFVFTSIKP